MLVYDYANLYQTDTELLGSTCLQWSQLLNEMICVAETFNLECKADFERELAKFKCFDC